MTQNIAKNKNNYLAFHGLRAYLYSKTFTIKEMQLKLDLTPDQWKEILNKQAALKTSYIERCRASDCIKKIISSEEKTIKAVWEDIKAGKSDYDFGDQSTNASVVRMFYT